MLGTPLTSAFPKAHLGGGGGGGGALPRRGKEAAAATAVLDERGRPLRLHGAFTGGFSAGYFNTVGSAEGWQPASFHSSRTSRAAPVPQLTMADYLDEEDDALLGATLAPTLAYDTQGARGLKRGRELVEAEAAGAAARGSLIPGPVPSELVVPVAVPVGRQILAAMAARGGASGAAAAALSRRAAALATPDYGIEALFREGTRRAPGARHGLGCDPGALREREDAATALARRARGVGAGRGEGQASETAAAAGPAAATGLGTRRLHMAHALSAMAYGEEEEEEGGGSRGPASGPGRPLLLRSGMAMGGGDEGEDDDAGAYRQPSLRSYDIPLNAREAAAMQRASQRAAPAAAAAAAAASAAAAAAGRAAGVSLLPLLKDAGDAGSSSGSSSGSAALGWDGQPAMPGFAFAHLIERTFSQWAKAYAPPTPPPGWQPAAIVAPPPPQGAPQQQQQPSAARLAMDALLSKQRFVSEGAAGAQGQAQGQAQAAAPVLAPIATGTRLARSQEVWLPPALLLKRFEVRDPFSREERQRLEVSGSAGGPASGGAALLPPAASSAQLGAAPGAPGAGLAPPPPPPPEALLATLAPIMQPEPPPSLFTSIFGAGWSSLLSLL